MTIAVAHVGTGASVPPAIETRGLTKHYGDGGALAGLDLGFMLGGVVVIEAVFGWPGMGAQAVRAIGQEDLPVLMGTLLFGTLCIVLASLVVDLVHALIDPRVTFDGRREAR